MPRPPITQTALVAFVALVALVARPLCAQQTAIEVSPDRAPAVSGARDRSPAFGPHASPTSAVAIQVVGSHVLAAREDDPMWAKAQLIDGFKVFDPKEDGEPSMRTTAKIAYDARTLYILVRMYDPHPDSIVALLSRRDVRTPSEWIKVMIDAYHDKRSGVELAVNPVGVKRDYAIYNDQDEDESWDGVWDVVTRVDNQGWIAEFKIPLSQLRFASKPSHTFGLMIWRDVARTQERSSWPSYKRNKTGLVSQFGEVSGIDGIEAPRRLEIQPYSVTKNFQQQRDLPAGTAYDRVSTQTIGADVKFGLSSNLTLDATINPDFGQVEADPASLNLSAFELFFQERRPFFTEGAGIFNSFSIDCNNGSCSGLFYPRRIGRSPQLSGNFYDATTPQFTPISAAAKLSGRLPGGMSIGILDAVTEQVRSPSGNTVEPQANYFVARIMQDLRGGSSGVGMMLTATNRFLDGDSDPFLRKSAYTGGLDWRHRFASNNYEASGWFVGSLVNGAAPAIARLQRNSSHGFLRPDGGLPYDSTRTSLDGGGASFVLSKTGGGITRFNISYQHLTPGFEMNDLGFQTRVDEQSASGWFALQFIEATSAYRRLGVNFNVWRQWTSNGLPTNGGGNINANAQLTNFWWVFGGLNVNNVGVESFDDRFARGGPAVRRASQGSAWLGFEGDSRKALVPNFFASWYSGDAGYTKGYDLNPGVSFRASSRMQGQLRVGYSSGTNDTQWYGNDGVIGNDTTHYTFARLDQRTINVSARFDVTMTPRLSLQLYAQPFVTTGHYTNWRELDNPKAQRYEDRFKAYSGAGSALSDFNYKQFRSNTVLRWEYRPGSTLFLVWSQGREQYDRDLGVFSAPRDLRNLFATQPNNTFLIKASYWFSM